MTDAMGVEHIVITRKRLIHPDTTDGSTPFIVAALSDVTQIRNAEARAEHRAGHDALTGLPNCSRSTQRLDEALNAARRGGSAIGVLLLDLDSFKPINDRFGRMVGDSVLQIVAKRLSGLFRHEDMVARFGGDEFCIVQHRIRKAEDAEAIASRVVRTIGQPIAIDPEPLTVSVSVGITIAPDDGEEPQLLLKCADQALYAAKRSGRCGYRPYDPTMMRTPAPTIIAPGALEAGAIEPRADPAFSTGTARRG